ncbi:hypothetical protein GEMRC1_007097 [Eukaryota sp. GEM-RC1]
MMLSSHFCAQLMITPLYGARSNTPYINAIIGTIGSGKTTFGSSWLNSLVDSTTGPDFRDEIRYCLNNEFGSSKILDFLIYLYLSGRFVAMELPSQCDEDGYSYLLSYISNFLKIDHTDVSTDVFSCLQTNLLKFSPSEVNSSCCAFSCDSEALDYWHSLHDDQSLNLPFLFFFDEVPNSDDHSLTTLNWFSFFRDLVYSRIGISFVAGLNRQYIDRNLRTSKFGVKICRLEAITSLHHLQEFLDSTPQLSGVSYDRKEALNCLIRCGGNPRVILRTIEFFCARGIWRVTMNAASKSLGLYSPLTNDLSIAAMPLALSDSRFMCDSVQADALSTSIATPKRLCSMSEQFSSTRYHCLLSVLDFDQNSSWSFIGGKLVKQLKQLIEDVIELFDDHRQLAIVQDPPSLLEFSTDKKHQIAQAFGQNFEELIGNFLLLRLTLLNDVNTTSNPSLVYLFGSSHTSLSPDSSVWMSPEYALKLNHGMKPLKSLCAVSDPTTVQQSHVALKIQATVPGEQRCTWEDLVSCRGKVWKNGADAAGPDIVLIDDVSNLIVGVDCKSGRNESPEIAEQFIQCLASHPPVALLFSIQCCKSASDMYQIDKNLTPSFYKQVYSDLKNKFPSRYEDEDFVSLKYRIWEEVGVMPQHVLMGAEFFGPTVANILKLL